MNTRRSERVSSTRIALPGNPAVVLGAILVVALLCLGLAIYSHWTVRKSFARAEADFNTRFEKMKADFVGLSTGTLPDLTGRVAKVEALIPTLASLTALEQRAKPLEENVGTLQGWQRTTELRLTRSESRLTKGEQDIVTLEEKTGSLEGAQEEANRRLAALNLLVPVKTILPFYGNTRSLPAEWVPCDGSTTGSSQWATVPDLRSRFLRGTSGSDSLGSTGGADTVDRHRHEFNASTNNVSFSRDSIDSTLDTFQVVMRAEQFHPTLYVLTINGSDSHGHTGGRASFSGMTDFVGGHDNRPRYISVHYICRIR
jgi:hypothetical protein